MRRNQSPCTPVGLGSQGCLAANCHFYSSQFVVEEGGSLVQLGEGAHGVVYLAKLGDMYCAVKVGG